SVVTRSEGSVELGAQCCRGKPGGESSERAEETRRRHHDATEQEERQEEAVGEGQGELGLQRPGEEEPDAGERRGPEEECQGEEQGIPSWPPAEQERDSKEDEHLDERPREA